MNVERPMSSPPGSDIPRSPAPHWGRGIALIIGVSIALTALYFVLVSLIGRNVMVQALLYSALPIAATIAARDMFSKSGNKGRRNGIVIAGVFAWYAFFVVVTAVATRI